LTRKKLEVKHDVKSREVFEVLSGDPRIYFDEKGDVEGEDIYAALGRTWTGRYLIVFFIYRKNQVALVTSAREMTRNERRRYGRK
jgi:uncharacterized protein